MSSSDSARMPWQYLSIGRAASKHFRPVKIKRDGLMNTMPTLVLQTRAGTCILEKRQQKRLHNIRAAMERCENIHQPPSSLTAVPAHRETRTQPQVKASPRSCQRSLRTSECWKPYGLELVLTVTCFITWQ